MDFKQLETFVVVAQTGSLSSASDRLRVAQPALSRRIRLLEDKVGLELFIRHGRGMSLSEAGSALLERVVGLMDQLEKAVEDVRSTNADPSGEVTIGIIPSIGSFLAAKLAIRAADLYSRISLRFVEGLAGQLVDWLQRGEVDMALLPGMHASLHLRTIDLLHENYCLVGPKSCDLRFDQPVPMSSLSSLDLILTGRNHGLRHLMEHAAAKANVRLNVRFEMDSLLAVLNMVEAGVGYTILPMITVQSEYQAGRFNVAPLGSPAVPRQLILALPRGRVETRAGLAIKAFVISEIAQLIHAGTWKATPDSGLDEALRLLKRQGRATSATSAKSP
jgi:DNA-binding transcriptional LysR family regulator